MITVTTRDIERTFPAATGWIIDEDKQLDVTKDDEVVVASFSPGEWQSVHQSSELMADSDTGDT